MNRYLSECLGTFFLVFAGTGAIIVNDVTGGLITHVGISLTFGLIVMVLIYALGDISGAHFNPAVSWGFWLAQRLTTKELLYFSCSQLSGSLLACTFLKIIFPQHPTLGASLPHFTFIRSAFFMETILTYLLMLVIIHVSEGSKEKGLMAGIAIGGTICLEALFAGPLTGASMNPVRSLSPSVLSGHLEYLWIYLTMPFLGAALAVGSCCLIQPHDCCRKRKSTFLSTTDIF